MSEIKTSETFYACLSSKIDTNKKMLGRPMSYAEKLLYSHLYEESTTPIQRGEQYASFRPDRVAMQDATAQMAILQFMLAGRDSSAVDTSVHCDHLIIADQGAEIDLKNASQYNKEVYDFLSSAASRYGMDFWGPGQGIIHQVVLENYATPGAMMVGTDSHTPNAGGLGMAAIGVGGADAVDVMTGMRWELKMPKIIGVKLSGKLSPWCSAKDVILKLLGLLSVKGGTNSVIEYFGQGVSSISATGRATICNMGAELGATFSVFPFDENSAAYLEETGREQLAQLCRKYSDILCADAEVIAHPKEYFDKVIELNLSDIEPHINGPFTPDAATTISEMKSKLRENPDYTNIPKEISVGLIGSCTNSSYEDLSRAASIINDALERKIPIKAQFIVNPGSERIRLTAERDGLMDIFRRAGALIMANACGPCIGQWRRHCADNKAHNTIISSFNRNFRSRADGNPNTYSFVASPEMSAALAIAGRLDFNPISDSLLDSEGNSVKLQEPQGKCFPSDGFASYSRPCNMAKTEDVIILEGSDRLQRLQAFEKWDGKDLSELPLLIKVKGKCTTDHISMAGSWLKYRGHLENISNNLLMGASNAFGYNAGEVKNSLNGEICSVAEAAKAYKLAGSGSIVIAEENYGEGSSREHAAMEPRFLGVKAVIAKSFARIHETNLKKQGVLAFSFSQASDYDKIQESDSLSILGISEIAKGKTVTLIAKHADGSSDTIKLNHSYNELQFKWFCAGSALNYLRSEKTIPYIEGDGVGAEVSPICRAVLDAAVHKAYGQDGDHSMKHIRWMEVLAGGKAYEKTGEWLPEDTLKAFDEYKIGIKGPLMTPVGGGIRSLNVALRQRLDLYVCQRPVRYFSGVVSPVKEPQKVDMCIFRENTEDIYAGIEWAEGSSEALKFRKFLEEEMGVKKIRFPESSAFGVKPVSREGTERLVRAAIKYALEQGKSSVTLVHKGNIMKYTEGGFKNWGYELAKKEFGEYLESGKLVIKDCICDAFLQNALLHPQDYSVIATLNLNGDYVSDMLAAQVGGIGIAPGANINYDSGHAIFEATHGIAPDIAGKNIVNPCSIILSGVMMLEFMGWNEAAELVIKALESMLSEGYATLDLAREMTNGKAMGTKEFGEMLINRIRR